MLSAMERDSARRLSSAALYPLTIFAVMVGLLGTWAIATPLFASPDEPAHLFKAYGTAHGEAIGVEVEGKPRTIRQFDVPLEMSTPTSPQLTCYFGKPDVSAACGQSAGGPPISTAAVLPPFWYAVVGGGARLLGADTSQRAYRMVNAALCASMFAAAFAVARRSRERRLSPLMLLAMTPVALMMSGTVHPNGFEIAAFMFAWALVLRADSPRAPTAFGGLLLGSLFAATLLSRFAAGMWVACLVVLAAIVLGRNDLKRFLNRWFLTALIGTTAVAVALLVAWSRYAGVTVENDLSRGTWGRWKTMTYTFGALPEVTLQLVGRLGWLDTRLPTMAYVLFFVFVGMQVVGVVLSRDRRLIAATALAFAGLALVPVLVNTISATTAGPIWQGRYAIPLVAGLGIMGMIGWRQYGARLDRRKSDHTISVVRIIACSCFALTEILGFWQALRRFSVGASGKIWLTGAVDWRPSVAPMLLIAANIALTVGLCAVILFATRGREASDESVAAGG